MPELKPIAIAKAWGLTAQTVRAYVRQGMPTTSMGAAKKWRAAHKPDPDWGVRGGGRKEGAGRPKGAATKKSAGKPKVAAGALPPGPLPTEAGEILRLVGGGKLTLYQINVVKQALMATQQSMELRREMGELVLASEVRDAWTETLAAFAIELAGIGAKVAIQAVAEFGLPLDRQHQLAAAVKRLIDRATDSVTRRGPA